MLCFAERSGGIWPVVTDPPRDQQRRDDQAEAVQVLVGEQLRAARTEVFRAYLQARERARTLVEEERDEAGRQGSTGA
jgi:F0F1-type ATP synthase membrane subunit b/b'